MRQARLSGALWACTLSMGTRSMRTLSMCILSVCTLSMCILSMCALSALSASAAEFAGRGSPPVSTMGQAAGVDATARDTGVDALARDSGVSASGRDTVVQPVHARTVETTRGSPEKGAVPKGVHAATAVAPRPGSAATQPRVSPIARSNADRLHALQKLQTGRRIAMPVSRLGSNRSAPGGNTAVGAGSTTLAGAGRNPLVGAGGKTLIGAGGNTLAGAGSNTLAGTRGVHGVGPAGMPLLPQSHAAVRIAAASKPAARALGVGGPRAEGLGLLGGPVLGRNANRAAVDGQLHQPKF